MLEELFLKIHQWNTLIKLNKYLAVVRRSTDIKQISLRIMADTIFKIPFNFGEILYISGFVGSFFISLYNIFRITVNSDNTIDNISILLLLTLFLIIFFIFSTAIIEFKVAKNATYTPLSIRFA